MVEQCFLLTRLSELGLLPRALNVTVTRHLALSSNVTEAVPLHKSCWFLKLSVHTQVTLGTHRAGA